MKDDAIPTYHRGARNYGTGFEMMERIDELEEALRDAISSTHQDEDLVDWREDARAALGEKP